MLCADITFHHLSRMHARHHSHSRPFCLWISDDDIHILFRSSFHSLFDRKQLKKKEYSRDHHLHSECAKHILQLLWACDGGRERTGKATNFSGSLCWGNQHHHYHRTLIRNLSRVSFTCGSRCGALSEGALHNSTVHTEARKFFALFLLADCIFLNEKNNFRNMELNKCAPRRFIFYFAALCVWIGCSHDACTKFGWYMHMRARWIALFAGCCCCENVAVLVSEMMSKNTVGVCVCALQQTRSEENGQKQTETPKRRYKPWRRMENLLMLCSGTRRFFRRMF